MSLIIIFISGLIGFFSFKSNHSNKEKLNVKSELNNSTKEALEEAISHFPELSDIQIEVEEKNIRTTMASRPKANFLTRKKEKRVYRLLINNVAGKHNVPLLDELSYRQKVGLIGHELSHIVDYMNRSKWDITKLATSYLTKNGKQKTEHRVDKIAIDHGLGEEVYLYTKFIFEHEEISNDYKKFKASVYYSPTQLLQLMPYYNPVMVD